MGHGLGGWFSSVRRGGAAQALRRREPIDQYNGFVGVGEAELTPRRGLNRRPVRIRIDFRQLIAQFGAPRLGSRHQFLLPRNLLAERLLFPALFGQPTDKKQQHQPGETGAQEALAQC